MEKTIYYSVNNGGDGSAYPRWFESMRLAEWDQDNQEEGFGESCTGSITFSGDNLKCLDKIETTEGLYARLKLDESNKLSDFIEEFYSEKELPKFTVIPSADRYYDILYNGIVIQRQFAYPENKPSEKKAKEFENYLNI